jgi:hypothetical protein
MNFNQGKLITGMLKNFRDRLIKEYRNREEENESILAYDSVIFSTIAFSNCALNRMNSYGSTAGSSAR